MTADRIKEERGKLKMTQVQLAAALGVNVLTVSAWEQGRQKPPAYLELALRGLREKQAAGLSQKPPRGRRRKSNEKGKANPGSGSNDRAR